MQAELDLLQKMVHVSLSRRNGHQRDVPCAAYEIERKVRALSMLVVDLARHVAMVNGLRRYLSEEFE